MRRLYDRFWHWLGEQETLSGRRAVAGLLGVALLAAGLLLLWLAVGVCDWLGLND